MADTAASYYLPLRRGEEKMAIFVGADVSRFWPHQVELNPERHGILFSMLLRWYVNIFLNYKPRGGLPVRSSVQFYTLSNS